VVSNDVPKMESFVSKVSTSIPSKDITKNESKSSIPSEVKTFSSEFSGDWKFDVNIIGDKELNPNSSHYKEVMKNLQRVKGFSVQKMEVISNLPQERIFHGSIAQVEEREKEDIFQPKLEIESSSKEREKVLKMVNELAGKTKHNRKVRILLVWHGTTVPIAHSIMKLGFASLAKLDEGWFGRGIYFSTYPEYSLRYCFDSTEPCLIMSYIILSNPYPVVFEDATPNLKMLGKGGYKNYGCNYVPVIHNGGTDYRPPKPGVSHKYDEVVIFQESHILPKLIIHLQKVEKKVPKQPQSSVESWDVNSVIIWMKSLTLSKDYTDLVVSQHLNGIALQTMETKDDWKEFGINIFGDVRNLIAATKKL